MIIVYQDRRLSPPSALGDEPVVPRSCGFVRFLWKLLGNHAAVEIAFVLLPSNKIIVLDEL